MRSTEFKFSNENFDSTEGENVINIKYVYLMNNWNDWFSNWLVSVGICMLKKFPYKGFRWGIITVEQIRYFDPEGNMTCFVEVDAVISVDLHEYLNDMPPFPESCTIADYITSQTTMPRTYLPIVLVRSATSNPWKEGYICHVQALQKWVTLWGLIERIGRVLWFQ